MDILFFSPLLLRRLNPHPYFRGAVLEFPLTRDEVVITPPPFLFETLYAVRVRRVFLLSARMDACSIGRREEYDLF